MAMGSEGFHLLKKADMSVELNLEVYYTSVRLLLSEMGQQQVLVNR